MTAFPAKCDQPAPGRVFVAMPYTDALCAAFLDVVAAPGHKYIALSGGRTPREFLGLLAGELRSRVPWSRISLYQVDERCVPQDHPESNWRMIRETLLDAVPGIEAHRIRTESRAAAKEYEQLISQNLPLNGAGVPIFDLVLLGLGQDGHTASLFPGTPALGETRRLVVRNPVPQLNTERITMTLPLLNTARRRWFIARGEPLRRVLEEVRAGQHPASRIREPDWFIEPEVAGAAANECA